MAAASDVARERVTDSDTDLLASPMERSAAGSNETCSTPGTEPSVPNSPAMKQGSLSRERTWARGKLAQLTQEEKVSLLSTYAKTRQCDADISQVSLLTAADFWRTKSIPSKGVPAAKTSDGPNGARGGIFVGGTKVCPTRIVRAFGMNPRLNDG